MNDILLAADIGNTDTVFGIFRGPVLAAEWRTPTAAVRSAPRTAQIVRLLLAEAGARALGGAVLSSVDPSASRVVARAVKRTFRITPYVIAGDDPAGFRVGYRDPKSLGPDRLCNAAAARHFYGAPVIVVDAGTAITFDVILRSGAFAGGAIAPGIAASARALARGTARLPEIPLAFPRKAIGRSTVEAMQSGVLFGAIDAVDGMIRRIRKLTGPGTTVVATGGHAGLLARHSRIIRIVAPSLVLEGARLLYEHRRTLRTRLGRQKG